MMIWPTHTHTHTNATKHSKTLSIVISIIIAINLLFLTTDNARPICRGIYILLTRIDYERVLQALAGGYSSLGIQDENFFQQIAQLSHFFPLEIVAAVLYAHRAEYRL